MFGARSTLSPPSFKLLLGFVHAMAFDVIKDHSAPKSVV